MTTIKFNRLSISIFYFIMMLSVTLLFQSCAPSHEFATSSVVPGAKGSVKVKKDNNNNYTIELSVMHLADPKRLSPPKQVYIVWMDTDENQPQNIGQLHTSNSLLSKTMKSSLKTVSSSKPTSFFITAEDESGIQYPSGTEVLRTGSF